MGFCGFRIFFCYANSVGCGEIFFTSMRGDRERSWVVFLGSPESRCS